VRNGFAQRFWLVLMMVAGPGGLRAEGIADFQAMKVGCFVHYVWSGDPQKPLTVTRDGVAPTSLDALADGFDAEGFAADLSAWGVEYVIFTAWHYAINPLFPSETMRRWGMPGHACRRDLLGDLIRAARGRGIRVVLYTHPRDGHDLRPEEQVLTGWGGPSGQDPDWAKFDRAEWNDFTNELYAELVDRYGRDIAGLYLDEGSGRGDSERVVDYPRLRRTIRERAPGLVMIQNFYGTLYTCDVGSKEYAKWGEFASPDGRGWPAHAMAVASCFSESWMSRVAAGTNTVAFSAADMFRYTVLQAGACTTGGGVQWAAGPYVGGGWETGVDATMRQVGALIRPVARAITNTVASAAYSTPPGATTASLGWGVATRSRDGGREYLHVLNPPAGGSRILRLASPADASRFISAALLVDGRPVALTQTVDAVVLTLPADAAWDAYDTVIELVRATAP